MSEEAVCVSTFQILFFVGAALLLGVIGGLLTGLLLRRSQLQRLQTALRGHRYSKAKLSDSELSDQDLWNGAVSDDEYSAGSDGESADSDDDLKMVLCVRTDLAMGKGKIAAQCGHAALGLFQKCQRRHFGQLEKWQRQGQAKVVLKIKDEPEMHQLYAAALQAKVPAFIVHDAGRTQIASGSATVLAVGPASTSLVDSITGHLKLL
eukprot:Protomagalhaensia_wolfi_Nauph_80__2735@NODE_2861_length_964_cov_15_057297_g2245_i0_p1_GENE_NODE_2861_length_964_cov_15_057297_g2245_i0NODE_2861_length_964_cov_15_057297_g2245_i0_p1_ORF_typecomplete_len207_score22_17PTH2/PF01981_16/4_5e45PhoR/PF11808_8/0_17PhoR/PF11808_8/5_4e02IncD/PF17628_2/0_13_NODE_2861_length_964_cov_15_057297_g2245_i0313933